MSPVKFSLTLISACLSASLGAAETKPNVVFILADDIGYGDFGCYGATKVRTPNADKLASQGLRFTDAHAPSAVCTPTRYAFLTGEYAWRKPGTGILPGIAGLIIEPGRTTVPSLLKRAGYVTAVIGKWHLGLGKTPTDYNTEIKPGPLEIGFDYSWIIPATGDRTPCVWVENHRVVNLDAADPIKLDYSVQRGEPRSFVGGVPRIGEQLGGKAALWKDDLIADVLAEKSIKFIEDNKSKPFFLYLATHDIHVPRVPNSRFRGTSDAGIRGDAVHSFDWTLGRILDTLDRLKLTDNTLVIVTSDNGGVLDTNGATDNVNSGDQKTNNGHAHNGVLRGNKGSAYEGGTRVPFIARWPGQIQPGTSGALISHVDMLSTFASLTQQKLAEADAPDSQNILPALIEGKAGRATLVEHGNVLALRLGDWKYLVSGSGAGKKNQEKAKAPKKPELYDLSKDLSETTNVADQNPEMVAKMAKLLAEIQAKGGRR